MNVYERARTCCMQCHEEDLNAQYGHTLYRLFIVCGTCGNKRCPKATNHLLDCTDSNEPGQPGSRFL